jgi:uncharacterized membrane protein
MTRISVIIITYVLLVYFFFTSGLFYWAIQYNKTQELIIPFSWALSAEDTGLTGVATKDDMECMNWLINESDDKSKIIADSNSIYLVSGYMELIPDTWAMYGREDRFVTFHNLYKYKDAYIFISSWNAKHGKMIETSDVGLRRQNDFLYKEGSFAYLINDHRDDTRTVIKYESVKEVFRSGQSVVLQKQY